MKQVIFIFMAILLGTGTILAQDGGASISLTENSYDFGSIKEADGLVTHTFTVKNDGDAPLVITRVIASCGCTSPQWTKEPIAPGQTGEVEVTFNPKGRPGPFSKSVSIYSNGKTGSYAVTIRGEVI
ncbi:hypothetical protein M2459_003365 [Parabacteroides sp. PF5-5]|uniref:DUF1573 domain-containing protein n=1 Tax=unclassified Parabacteroides TaxID=2649774 RepID=UPI0024739547|nr:MULTISPECIES: DUF1573 domain-containing protein [unclassified Parabacteroides]MDH6306642.1 hypothetical protein [Parabacteroides sp. PH5-39]MDH6317609.1 hypothetical protein [Parabacteroides sp. PF5-13]MDH6321353.1 hypothetical protein [Parabacteroides sp. PH5-13]MDH6325082.1 hypothetical protein [Parabacteroides sp. PH5-8]MDH6328791.1 hypothetical protein [Parabacteroides sp. PH5-41]